MRRCWSIPRYAAEGHGAEVPKDFAWISIQEEDHPKSNEFYPHSKNEFLDKLPNLKLKFSDVEEPVKLESLHEYIPVRWYRPPNKRHAKKIVDFILANSDKNIIVNCAAGISRSGAICKFLEEQCGYKWDVFCKTNSDPNVNLYNLLVEYHTKIKENHVH